MMYLFWMHFACTLHPLLQFCSYCASILHVCCTFLQVLFMYCACTLPVPYVYCMYVACIFAYIFHALYVYFTCITHASFVRMLQEICI